MKTIRKNTLNRLLQFLSTRERFVFLDTSKPIEDNKRSLLFLDPIERLQYFEGDDEEDYLFKIQTFQREGFYIAGWLTYEFGCLLESTLRRQLCRKEDRGALLADLGVFKKPYIFDHENNVTDFPLEEIPLDSLPWEISDLSLSQEREEYIQAVNRVLEYIKAGDTYQVNYTLKLLFNFTGSPESFYRDLRRNQSVSYGAFIKWGDEMVMSFSPELFFSKNGNEIKVRPMKGTLARGRTLEEDNANRLFLSQDIKNRSENVMIVDLLRNDLGRLMHYLAEGDVRVESLFDVEVYETLLQMTSTIKGKAGGNDLNHISLHNFLKAIFPCGSVTGAPKIRTMEIIDELEKNRRGIYTGAIGYLAPSGEAVFNVPIRTVVLNGNHGEMGIGSGIVHDSVPENEWQECLLKGRFLTHPQEEFELIETILWHPEHGYRLLNEHLKRLDASAKYFLFSCNIKEIKNQLENYCRPFANCFWRVRLTLAKDGTCHFHSTECSAPRHYKLPEFPLTDIPSLPKIMFYEGRIDSNSTWHYHKTTKRDLYNREYERAREKDYFDTCFCNEKGEVTEGCITNIVIQKNGEFLTPPIPSGLLAGVMREHLIQDSVHPLRERVLKIEDLRGADALYVCNSVRGVVQVQLVE